jgi:hypothetical protein
LLTINFFDSAVCAEAVANVKATKNTVAKFLSSLMIDYFNSVVRRMDSSFVTVL